MFSRALLILLLIACAFVAQPADARTVDVSVKRIGVFGPWKALRYEEEGRPVCYMLGAPKGAKVAQPENKKIVHTNVKTKSAKTDTLKRGEIFLMVTLRPSENMNPVVSYKSGYLFKSGSEAVVTAGEKNFRLFTERDQAWARSASTDRAIVDALRNAKSLSVEGKAGSGQKSLDVFDLAGSTAAYKAISNACGMRMAKN